MTNVIVIVFLLFSISFLAHRLAKTNRRVKVILAYLANEEPNHE